MQTIKTKPSDHLIQVITNALGTYGKGAGLFASICSRVSRASFKNAIVKSLKEDIKNIEALDASDMDKINSLITKIYEAAIKNCQECIQNQHVNLGTLGDTLSSIQKSIQEYFVKNNIEGVVSTPEALCKQLTELKHQHRDSAQGFMQFCVF